MADPIIKSSFEAFKIETMEPLTGWSEAKGVSATALKYSRDHVEEDRDAWVVRLLETHGRPVRVRIVFAVPLEQAEAVTLVEEPIRPLVVTDERLLDLGAMEPGALLTLRLYPKERSMLREGKKEGHIVMERGKKRWSHYVISGNFS